MSRNQFVSSQYAPFAFGQGCEHSTYVKYFIDAWQRPFLLAHFYFPSLRPWLSKEI
jgi:hypothetical protein